MGQGLLKTEYVNLPLRVPKIWVEFFDHSAVELRSSRAVAINLALSFGAPLLQESLNYMKETLKAQIMALREQRRLPATLILPPKGLVVGVSSRDESRNDSDSGRRTTREPANRRKGRLYKAKPKPNPLCKAAPKTAEVSTVETPVETPMETSVET